MKKSLATLAYTAFLVSALFGQELAISQTKQHNKLVFGQVYGSVGFVSGKADGTMRDAPGTLLVFMNQKKHRTIVRSNEVGDYIALLVPGGYCLSAFSKDGQTINVDPRQRECISVQGVGDVRLDVMLLGQ
jgi:hypothetical protein